MNGNVSREGITLDLEAMQRVGVSGVMIFDGSDYLPAGPASYLGPKWRELMTHTIQEGNRLGVEIGMHNGPGWSSSGGPWVTPELSMQQLVWTEISISGGGAPIEVELARPHTNAGYYRDAFVVAFPSLPAETRPYAEALSRVRAGEEEVPKHILSDGQFETTITVSPEAPLVFEFSEPVDLHGLTALPALKGRFPRLQVEVSIDGDVYKLACTVTSPARQGIVAPGARAFGPLTARFVRVTPSGVGELADLVFHRAPRIADWVAKANFDYRVTGQLNLPDPGPADGAIRPQSVVDLTGNLNGDRLVWQAPHGAWTILRIGHTTTGKTNVAASAAGRGLEIDKFNPAAAEFHFSHVMDVVSADAAAVGTKGLSSVTIDSYEAGMQNWTASFPAEFERRAGYAIQPWLPALFGRIVGDAAKSERFLYDFRRVQADLMAEHYYERMHELARERGLKFYVEGYGPGNFDELRIAGLADVPMTEFWTRTPWTPNRVVKMVTSAAHVYGKRVVGAESFTGEFRTSRWLEYPYALKILGDEMAAQGVNLTVFHRYAHQPHPDAVPGMAMGPYGFHFDRTNTWFEQSGDWLETLSRTGYLLQQGSFSADVLYYTGERAPDPSQYAMPVLPNGYTYDLVNTDVLLRRIEVRDGHYVLPDGGRYRLLVLPPDLKAMRPALARKLSEFVAAGAPLLGPKPLFSPALADQAGAEAEMLRQVDALWEGKAGPGRVIATGTIADALAELAIAPDVIWRGERPDADLSWQHRRLASGDLFFIANRQRREERVVVSLRAMAGRQPKLWYPATGKRLLAAVHGVEGDRALVPLDLGPAESVFVLFRTPAEPAPAALLKDGVPIVSVELSANPHIGASGEFAMAIWVKPDTDLRAMPRESTTGRIDEVGKFYAIPADPGDLRFGPGHATAGLAVGRNGIFVVERSNDACPAVLVSDIKVSGWTHVAVVYRAGKPRLYVNGVFVKEGLSSGSIVHSGVGSPVPPVDYLLHFPGIVSLTRAAGQPPPPSRGQVFYFEGNSVPPQTLAGSIDDATITALAAEGPPAPTLPIITDLTAVGRGRAEATVWEGGGYRLGEGPIVPVSVSKPVLLSGPWKVAFQAGRGAPDSIVLPALQSLHTHEDYGVRHFAGTATYSTTFSISQDDLHGSRRMLLDLGRVEVVAEVRINGRPAGSAWKEPYRIDITDTVQAGSNKLEVRVTTLWPNRLIGDESLPAEDSFGIRDEQGNDPHGILKLPDWYAGGLPKPPGGRVTFSTWRFYEADEPLVASGLLGPVRLVFGQRVHLDSSAPSVQVN